MNVLNANTPESHLLVNVMDVKLNVLGASMMCGVIGDINGGDVVIVHHGSLSNVAM